MNDRKDTFWKCGVNHPSAHSESSGSRWRAWSQRALTDLMLRSKMVPIGTVVWEFKHCNDFVTANPSTDILLLNFQVIECPSNQRARHFCPVHLGAIRRLTLDVLNIGPICRSDFWKANQLALDLVVTHHRCGAACTSFAESRKNVTYIHVHTFVRINLSR